METKIIQCNGLRLKFPRFTCALGSTRIADDNWKESAIGAAISGTMQVIGKNLCSTDFYSKFNDGKVVHSPELEWRERGYGAIAVQANIEDTRPGVLEYRILDLGVDAVELKWGQGA